jgi:hypothetical protein
MHPGDSPQGLHAQAGIIRQGPLAGGQRYGLGLETGVGGKGVAGFIHLQAFGLRLGVQPQIRQ